MEYKIEIDTVNPQPVVGIRAITHLEDIGAVLAELLSEVIEYIEQQGAQPAGPPYNRYHSTQMGAMELEIGFPVAEPMAGAGRVAGGDLPGGKVARTVHFGPYVGLRDAYRAMGIWLKENKWNTIGRPWELYVVGPGEEHEASLWRTEIFWPVEPADP